MNAYDFDGTIYKNDSTFDFYKYALKTNPGIIKHIIKQAWAVFLYIIGIYSKKQMKEKFHIYLRSLDNVNQLVESFWDCHQNGIYNWYLSQKRSDDLVISASPEFIVRPMCKRIGVSNVIGTIVDPLTGQFLSENNKDEEKVRRFKEIYKDAAVEEFYSDSMSDAPMAKLASRSFYVKKSGEVIAWEDYKPSMVKRFKNMFLRREFIMYAIVGFINAFNGVALAWLISFAFQANIAYAAGYILAVIISFFINSFLTFKKRPTFGRFWRFIFSYFPSFVIQNISVLIFYNLLGTAKLIAYIIAAAIGLPLTFLFMKVFAFKK